MTYSWQKEIILPGNLYLYLTAEDHYWTASIKKREVKGLKVKAFFLFLKPQHVKNWKISIKSNYISPAECICQGVFD